jgi:hypothetical protein
MAHNFRPFSALLDKAYPNSFSASEANLTYVSKAGSSTNAGTKDAPLSNLNQAGSALVIGTGTYQMPGTGAGVLIADGNVVVRGPGFGTFCARPQVFGLDITGYEYICNQTAGSGGNTAVSFCRCILRNGKFNILNDVNVAENLLRDSILIGCETVINSMAYATSPSNQVQNNLFLNSPTVISGLALPLRCFFDAASPLTVASTQLPMFCNIRGTLTIDGTLYGSLADAAVVWPALLTRGNFNNEPGFNKPAAEDFTLRLSSRHLDFGVGPSHLRYALMYYVEFDGAPGDICTTQNTRLRSTADGSAVAFLAIEGFTVNEQGGLVIATNSNGDFAAYYRTDRIRLAATAQPIESLPVIFAANFDSDYPTTESAFSSVIPEIRNNNVPARNNYSSGSAGRNPHRLTIRARHSPTLNPSVTQPDDWVGSTWFDYEIGQRPTFNITTGFGNGHPSFDSTPANVTQMEARWAQFEYWARNNYYSR